jgi:hypothetical protein
MLSNIFSIADPKETEIKNLYKHFITGLEKLDELDEHSYIFLQTIFKSLSFHLHLDRTLGRLMNTRGILRQCLNNIKREIERMKVSHTKRNC